VFFFYVFCVCKVKGAAGRQRLKALLVLADAGHAAWAVERTLLRGELEAWRARDAAVSLRVGSLANDLEGEWQRRAGAVLAAQIVQPLTAALAAFRALAHGDPKGLHQLRLGAGGPEAAALVEALALHQLQLEAGLASVAAAPTELRATAAKHRARLAQALAARPQQPQRPQGSDAAAPNNAAEAEEAGAAHSLAEGAAKGPPRRSHSPQDFQF
jgi:hypothetical protein